MAEESTIGQTNLREAPVIEEQSRALMQAVPDLVFLLGLDGKYIDIFSAAAEDLFLPREDLIGKTVLDVLPSPVGDDCMEAIHKLKSPRDVSSFSYELAIDGNPRWFEGRVALCGANTVIVLVRDFTEQRLAERDLRGANRILQHRNQQLQRLEQELTRVEQRERQRMAHLLHDNLQQQLVGAKLNVSFLAGNMTAGDDQDTAKEVVKALDEAISQSQMLAADLCPPILYEGSLEQSLEWIRTHVARLYGLDVTVSINTCDNIELAEPARFTVYNAIQELLLNTVKHAGVTEASIVVSTLSDNLISIIVRDDGEGFSPTMIDQEALGTGGFGLFTLQERISWLGGCVDIKSQPGNGCVVTINIPVKVDGDHSIESSNTISSPNPLIDDLSLTSSTYNVPVDGTIRVLLADDHSVLREGLINILSQDSTISIVGEAANGESAVELAAKLKPDVILMDVMMHGMGGAEATRIIKHTFPDIQVIALSMYEEHERGSEMKEAGASAFITKRKAASTVVDIIHTCCKQ
jgi:PAS domain S-box-containing protein